MGRDLCMTTQEQPSDPSAFFRWACHHSTKRLTPEQKKHKQEKAEEAVEAGILQMGKSDKSAMRWVQARLVQEAAKRFLKERPDYQGEDIDAREEEEEEEKQDEGKEWPENSLNKIKAAARWDFSAGTPRRDWVEDALDAMEQGADGEWCNSGGTDNIADWAYRRHGAIWTDRHCTVALLERVLPAMLAFANNIDKRDAACIFESLLRWHIRKNSCQRLTSLRVLCRWIKSNPWTQILFDFDCHDGITEHLPSLVETFVSSLLANCFDCLASMAPAGVDKYLIAGPCKGPLSDGSRFLRAIESLPLCRDPERKVRFDFVDAFVGDWQGVSRPPFFSSDDDTEAAELRKTCLDRARCALIGLPVAGAASGDMILPVK